MNTHPKVLAAIQQYALLLGFDACGMAVARPLEDSEVGLSLWLSQGRHATLSYLERNFAIRLNPQLLVDGAQTVIVLLESYLTDGKPSVNAPVLGRYAWQRDYHVRMKERLAELDHFIAEHSPVETYASRCFVDTAPIMEKVWAVKAGLGWIGKNALFIHPNLGSYVNIGLIVCNDPLGSEKDMKELNAVLGIPKNGCGTCARCQSACPGKALEQAGSLDVERCFSYQSTQMHPTENKRTLVGCDYCQEACPWNQKALKKQHPVEAPWNTLYRWTYEDWLNLDLPTYNALCRETSFYKLGLPFLQERVKMLKNTIFEPENET